MGQWDDPYNILGFAGGVILASALLPQIYVAHKRQSTADISYMWQTVYIVGLLTLMVYYAHFRLWPVFYPMTFEMFWILYLTGLKIYHEAALDDTSHDTSRSGHLFRMPPPPSSPGMNGRMGSGLALSRAVNNSSLSLGEENNRGSGKQQPVVAADPSSTTTSTATTTTPTTNPDNGGKNGGAEDELSRVEEGNGAAAAAAAAAAETEWGVKPAKRQQ